MPPERFCVGITRDTLRDDGTPIFDPLALRMFDNPQCEWEFIAENVKELTAAHAARYDALGVLNPRVRWRYGCLTPRRRWPAPGAG